MTDVNDIDREIAEAARELGARRRTSEVLPPSPSPATPPSSPMGQMNELLQAMVSMETWKEKLLANERQRESAVETRIRAQVERELANVSEEMDPGVKVALDLLVSAFKSSVNTPTAAKPIVPPAATPTNDFVPPVAQEEPMLTTEQADAIAEQIFSKYPQEVKDTNAGIIPKAAALVKLKENGANDKQAEMIYTSIMELDWTEGR